MSDEVYSAMTTLREFLYDYVYRSPSVHNEFVKAKKILSELYTYFLRNKEKLQKRLASMEISGDHNHAKSSDERMVCDLIASMTDNYALELYKTIFFPSPLV
jgi:dGTPase